MVTELCLNIDSYQIKRMRDNLVNQHPINFVYEEQVPLIINGEKIAFIRIEDKWTNIAWNDWRNGIEVYLVTGHWEEINAWLKVIYMDFFKWKELKNQPILIQRCGFKDKSELKNNLIRLYGDILKDENPYLYYIEFSFKPFPETP